MLEKHLQDFFPHYFFFLTNVDSVDPSISLESVSYNDVQGF